MKSLLAGCMLLAAAASAPALAESGVQRTIYAVLQSAKERGAIAVYDIDAGHRLLKTIPTVSGVHNIRGVAASAATGRLYVAYSKSGGVGMIYCLDLATDRILWNRAVAPGVDRLAIAPDGKLLYVPTGEDNTEDHINIVDAASGDVVRKVRFSNRSHDAQFPLSGPLFQETKAEDGSGRFLYRVEPETYAVSRIGPYSGILGPYAVDSASRYVVNDVGHLWGMQVADLKSGRIVTASISDHPPGDPGLLHGIGWRPDEQEVWQSSAWNDPQVFVWDMREPLAPVLRQRLALRGNHGSHWLTFSILGDFAYIAPEKGSDQETEIFDARNHLRVGAIGSSEDLLEVDFADGKVSRVGDQFGIGRR